ncbi:thaumatin family-domain-containing protein [Elsinoe ampelina]|uniref:Thaumatin family-domain-containing protein n=1 Tax=Elsinoe ampelina TaxID=302913 RepID=A0A6A6GAQ2_9PEZI|nr:thaumatin family-domain-containing protein [Elsinoe ampelina]
MRTSALVAAFAWSVIANAEHHMKRKVEIRQGGSTSVPLVVTNRCAQTIYPGFVTQGGTGPGSQGFELRPGTNRRQTVSTDWQGRIWGRTNCSFNAQGNSAGGGPACSTGDCGGTINCVATGETPVTLAEFTLNGSNEQTFYDISLVDGYNLPMAIVTINPSSLPPNRANPSCVATEGQLAPMGFNPYSNGEFLGTNASSPLPFENRVTDSQVSMWCPWDLQQSPPTAPGNGVYPYPDTNIDRPAFNPCLSACTKYRRDNYCCTGASNGPDKCTPNYYAKAAKAVCPDAYSFAYDDQTSTFITQRGPGFEIIFCPGGRSTQILTQASTSGSSSSSGGSFISALDRSNPILDALIGTSGKAIVSGLAVVAMVMFTF